MMRRCCHCKKRHLCSKRKAVRLRRVSKRSTKNEETAKIREEAGKRSGGYCEVAGCSARAHALDHWLGGSGRRREAQSVETTWALCFHCNTMRTANTPTAAFWNARFREHCDRYGYSFTPHIVHEPIARKAAP